MISFMCGERYEKFFYKFLNEEKIYIGIFYISIYFLNYFGDYFFFKFLFYCFGKCSE